jgi:hypothetical protein
MDNSSVTLSHKHSEGEGEGEGEGNPYEFKDIVECKPVAK